MLYCAEELVVVGQVRGLLVRDRAGLLEPGERLERGAHAKPRLAAASLNLENLRGELHVADSAEADLDVRLRYSLDLCLLLDPLLVLAQGADELRGDGP